MCTLRTNKLLHNAGNITISADNKIYVCDFIKNIIFCGFQLLISCLHSRASDYEQTRQELENIALHEIPVSIMLN